MVVRPGRQSKKQVARLSDTAVPRAGHAATGGAPCGDIQRGGGGEQCATQGLPGWILEPTSCPLAMKRHGPFSSPSHVCDHEPFFFIHWDRAIPQLGYPQP